ncbi:hypothetical protein BCR22_12420 [Enterococcus plantarum]|uniref:WxL domain-containing protein n=1 Tax=Enterococcus plantarum TaxID=1077675 RepID=UPI00084D126E|nr:WxL domain-containing protein [Enterococcus plantarum]OEG17773.1 hypothetical protein BCR22_12420 [Enterococcus plantarum]
MKNSTKLASAALVTAISFGALAPQVVKADGNVLTGKGKIEFTSTSTSSSTTPTNPPGGSNGGSNASGALTDSSAGNTTQVGPFGISYVTNLDFDKHSIVASAANAETYWANTWVANAGTTSEIKNSNFIKFKDTRAALDHTYEVAAKITKPFTATVGTNNTAVTLNGATITYTNPRLVAETGTEASLAPTAGLNANAVVTGDASTPIVSNVNTANAPQFTTGYGEWSLLWGEYNSDAAQDTSAKSIQLTIPRGSQNAVIQEGAYTAEITWTMSDTPA